MAFVWAFNSGRFLVNDKGRVKDHNKVDIPPKRDLDGYKYVEIGNARHYVHELVLANHGKPPHKNRLPREGEVPVFLDGDTENTSIDNLEYRKESTSKTFRQAEGVPDAVEDYVWELLKKGTTYTKIQEMIAESNYGTKTISHSKISQIRKERSEKAEGLSPSDRQGLNVIKRELGETDDVEANRQRLAKEHAQKRSEKAKQDAREAEKEAAREEVKKNIENAIGDFKAVDQGGGWWRLFQGAEDISPKNYREEEAKTIVDILNKGNKESEDLLDVLEQERLERESK